MHTGTRASATIARFEKRLALTQQALRSFGDALRAAIDGLDDAERLALVVTADVTEPSGEGPSHALTVVAHVYGYFATVAADGAERVSATASFPALADRLASIDGVLVRAGVPALHAPDATMTASDFLTTIVDAVVADVDRRGASYNPALEVDPAV